MPQLSQASREALSDGGALATRLDAFAARDAQLRLTGAIADAIEQRDVLLAEAGTGTGKTYAYLVPALLSGLKTIVSTGTRALQDQLYHRDLPRVRDALGVGLKSALLKGRANYLCRYRLQQAKGEPRFTSREQVDQFQRIVAWSGRTQFGDMAELAALAEDSPLLPMVTSTVDNCLGSECPFWEECFVVQARQRAQAADVVVVNHHLLLADLALKQEGFGEILPGAQTFVIDEAHQLPELAANFFGEGFGMRPLQELARDCLAECKDVPGALASLQEPVRAIEQSLRELRLAMEGLPVRGTRERALGKPEVAQGFDTLTASLAQLFEAVLPMADSSLGLEACAARARELSARLLRWLGEDEPIPGFDDEPLPASADVFWYELTQRGFRCQRTPLDVSGPLREHRERSHAAWIFTSATLAVGGDFDHVATRLGLEDPQTLLQPSPFDWERQALCYLPAGLPDPNARGYGTALIATLWPVLQASDGRAFLLFASHRALREAAETLRDGPWPLFVQGEAPRATLLQRFRESGNGVLLGAASFREGVDVVGDALSVVVIDKLPFAAPDDPVFEARLDAIRRSGGNPFRDEQLPQAVIALKQGVGRLIRSETDRGVLVLCDPRLSGKSYGRVFLDSLPPFARTRRVEDVQAFFARESAPVTEESRA
ncbi:ATP-dependent DNA helicase [Pseudoxanthomonas wuyuanensis]|uniref:ATP-dependent DNA helicase DinG n=1 Tax=Pseudoxanthomonas wuyuanensis TaxID=1073196 RepID=A0A286D7U0_9GAMM|nr:ATP-dependent DNA helicase [Pseudoxanthomonas wuyuanensis]KAF1720350.1 ATP-dependent DNA helicase [Pseudoxanthomonas wuyuanensis]SOD54726.1 ATP-dependent DNA helicase DinG [Pseudoxanthomonas wuyuanensis]